MSASTSFTYNALIAALSVWLEDSSAQFVANQQTIVSMGESRLASDLNFEIFDRVVTGALTPGVFVQSIKTTAWQGTRSLHLRDVGGTGLRRYLQRRPYEWCLDFEPDESMTAEPLYYSELEELDFFMVPAANVAYGFELREIQAPDALTVANQNTWLGDNAGDMLLYACLLASDEFLKSDSNDLNKWRQSYSELMPIRRLELRRQIRADYSPVKNAARTVENRP